MIKYIARKNINIEKYDNCILNAINSRVYAYSWYLDVVTNCSWDLLVLDDYVAVMPLPKRKKYFIYYIYLPSWSQQLGVFSLGKITSDLVSEFIKSIPKKFKLVDVFLNTENNLEHKLLKERINYILPLNESYEVLFKDYKKGRKSSVKQGFNFNLDIVHY